MAEFNLFLGTARKSVGDITLYRREGRQIARVRVREVANPRSESQCETRNFLAPVIRFYGSLRDVLARSFEGLNTSRSYNEFQRVNIALARKEQWFLPKGEGFWPLPYQLSRGQLQPMTYDVRSILGTNSFEWRDPSGGTNFSTIGNVSTQLVAKGYKVGDVVTIILVTKDADGNYQPASRQFAINTLSAESVNVLSVNGLRFNFNQGGLVWEDDDIDIVAIGVIVARKHHGRWLRSTQRLTVIPSIVGELTSATQRAAAIKSYGPKDNGGGGGVYPGGDGEAYNCQTISGRALLFYGGQYNAREVIVGTVHFITLLPANLEQYMFLINDDGNYLGTNSAGSLNPTDWRYVAGTPAGANAENTINVESSPNFLDYMHSIGYPQDF